MVIRMDFNFRLKKYIVSVSCENNKKTQYHSTKQCYKKKGRMQKLVELNMALSINVLNKKHQFKSEEKNFNLCYQILGMSVCQI